MISNRKSVTIELVATIILIGFCFSTAFHYILGYYLHLNYPLNTFLFEPGKEFSDFMPIYGNALTNNPYHVTPNSGGVYFPFTYIFLRIFTWLKFNFSLFTFLLSFIICFFWLNKKLLSTYNSYSLYEKIGNFKNLFIVSFMSYPFLFTFERANIEFFVFLFTAIGLVFYKKEKFYQGILFLSVATVIKGFPGVFLFLFLSDKRYKEAFSFVALCIALTIFPMLIFKDTIYQQITGLLINLDWLKDYFCGANVSLLFSTSLYGILKGFLHLYHHIPWDATAKTSNKNILIYSIFAFASLMLLAIYVLFFEKIFWKKVSVLVFSYLLLPQISFDYRLLHIFIIFYFFSASEEIISDKMYFLYTILISFLLIPKNYYLLYGPVSISCLINSFLLLFFLFTIIFSDAKSKFLLRCKQNAKLT